jgi:hypothetical protein
LSSRSEVIVIEYTKRLLRAIVGLGPKDPISAFWEKFRTDHRFQLASICWICKDFYSAGYNDGLQASPEGEAVTPNVILMTLQVSLPEYWDRYLIAKEELEEQKNEDIVIKGAQDE